ncbi:MAG: helix-turn-helix transcriptional regulator [Polyangiaceae bacterium]|nr:helix-turn-helix transcriptional regulator [Polyangiaceae bacterium]
MRRIHDIREARLSVFDIGLLFDASRSVRETGGDASAWRRRLAVLLNELCFAPKVAVMELTCTTHEGTRACLERVAPVQIVDFGVEAERQGAFYDRLVWGGLTDPSLSRVHELWGSSFTVLRRDLVARSHWQQSALYNGAFLDHGCGDFLLSVSMLHDHRLASVIVLWRSRDQAAFKPRERSLVALLHHQIKKDVTWAEAAPPPALSPRLRAILARLDSGASEKEVAVDLGISTHTVHGYVKELRRRYGAHSRAQLIALARQRSPALKLATDVPLQPNNHAASRLVPIAERAR